MQARVAQLLQGQAGEHARGGERAERGPLAEAQGGVHENGRRTWGHSMIVDPWGEVLAVRPEGEGVVLAELDPARIAEVRGQLPALTHRRC